MHSCCLLALGEETSDNGVERYESYASLNHAIAGGDSAPAVLLTLEYLFELQDKREMVPCRQDLPQHAKFTGTVDAGVLVLALSYCWGSDEHPDPECKILDDVCAFGRYIEETRHVEAPDQKIAGICHQKVIVFWDFASLYQKVKGRPRTNAEEQSFMAGLGIANVLYAHKKTWVLLCTSCAYGETSYQDSAWPFFQWSLSQLIKGADLSLDLPTALDFIEDKKADRVQNRSLRLLREACRQHSRVLALTPHDFNAALARKTGQDGVNKELLKRRYRQTFQASMLPATGFQLCDVAGVNTATWGIFLSGTMPLCRHLREVDLSFNEAVNSTLRPFEGLVVLEVLRISLCVGIHGTLRSLGRLSHLQELLASGCLGLQGDLEPLAGLMKLHTLNIEACTGLRGSVEPLLHLPDLTVVEARGTDLDGWDDVPRTAAWSVSGPPPNVLHVAASYGMLRAVGLLLDHGLRVEQVKDDGSTPLHAAARQGHAETVRLLLKRGAAVDQASDAGRTPLYVAAEHGRAQAATALLDGRAAVDQAKRDGATPLIAAAQSGRPGMVGLLLKRGAAADQAMRDGATPLLIAAQNGHSGVMQVLAEHGAKVDQATSDGRTLLLSAAYNGHASVVCRLLEFSAGVNKAFGDGATPLFVASQAGHAEIARQLLWGRAAVDQDRDDDTTPLCVAAQFGHAELVRLLLEHGATVDKATVVGKSPLYVAAENGHAEVVRQLLEEGARANQVRNDFSTPLYVAKEGCHSEVVHLLAEGGAHARAPTTCAVS